MSAAALLLHLIQFLILGSIPALASVAIAVQGRAAKLTDWRDIVASSFFAVKEETHLFLLTFDEPTVQGTYLTALFAPNSTWTQGRNLLSKAIYAHEKKDGGKQFKYWLFADSDMAKVSCNAATKVSASNRNDVAALCLSRHIQHYLLSSLGYASVFFLGSLGREDEHYKFDCGDAQFHAIHRSAAPVLLPYVERLDAISWQESQVLLWRVAAGCLANSGAGAGILSLKQEDREHSPYPGGSFPKARADVITETFGLRHGLSPHPIDNSTFNTVQGDCAGQPNQVEERKTRPEVGELERRTHHSSETSRRRLDDTLPPLPPAPDKAAVTASQRWMNDSIFHLCHKRLRHRFDKYMSGASSLAHLDGPALDRSSFHLR